MSSQTTLQTNYLQMVDLSLSRRDTATLLKLWCPSSPLVCRACPFKRRCRACGQQLPTHAYGQQWPEEGDQSRQISKTMLQYRETSDRDICLSQAQIIFGQPIKNFIPILPGSYRPHSTWIETSQG